MHDSSIYWAHAEFLNLIRVCVKFIKRCADKVNRWLQGSCNIKGFSKYIVAASRSLRTTLEWGTKTKMKQRYQEMKSILLFLTMNDEQFQADLSCQSEIQLIVISMSSHWSDVAVTGKK